MIKTIRRALRDVGCLSWQWTWTQWSLPHYSAHEDTIDYGMPEYAGMYPTYLVNILCVGPYQCRWYSNYQQANH